MWNLEKKNKLEGKLQGRRRESGEERREIMEGNMG
jgi:hypothetical protein